MMRNSAIFWRKNRLVMWTRGLSVVGPTPFVSPLRRHLPSRSAGAGGQKRKSWCILGGRYWMCRKYWGSFGRIKYKENVPRLLGLEVLRSANFPEDPLVLLPPLSSTLCSVIHAVDRWRNLAGWRELFVSWANRYTDTLHGTLLSRVKRTSSGAETWVSSIIVFKTWSESIDEWSFILFGFQN